MRADSKPTHQDFPWQAVLRSEMGTWNPVGLPERFRPRRIRPRLTPRPELHRAWLPAAAAGAALLVAMVTYTQAPARAAIPTVSWIRLGSHTRAVAPPSPAPTRPARTAAPTPAAPQGLPIQKPAVAVPPQATESSLSPDVTPSWSPPEPGSQPSDLLLSRLLGSPAPSPTPSPSCLSLNLICI